MVHHIQKITVARSPVFCQRKDEYQQEYLHTYASNIAEKTKATVVALLNSKNQNNLCHCKNSSVCQSLLLLALKVVRLNSSPHFT